MARARFTSSSFIISHGCNDVANPRNIVSSTVEINLIEFEKFLLITNASLDFSPSFFPHLGRSRMMQTRARSAPRQKVTAHWQINHRNIPSSLPLRFVRLIASYILVSARPPRESGRDLCTQCYYQSSHLPFYRASSNSKYTQD
jgi:hypothetical protein